MYAFFSFSASLPLSPSLLFSCFCFSLSPFLRKIPFGLGRSKKEMFFLFCFHPTCQSGFWRTRQIIRGDSSKNHASHTHKKVNRDRLQFPHIAHTLFRPCFDKRTGKRRRKKKKKGNLFSSHICMGAGMSNSEGGKGGRYIFSKRSSFVRPVFSPPFWHAWNSSGKKGGKCENEPSIHHKASGPICWEMPIFFPSNSY